MESQVLTLESFELQYMGENMRHALPARVYTFGTFDGLHPGHWWYLRQARRLGSHLTVIVGRDENVRRIKGRAPLYSQEQRVARMRRSGWADDVRLGGTGKPLDLLQAEDIDVICLGYDQHPSDAVLRTELDRIGKSAVRVYRARALFPGLFKSSRLKRLGLFRSSDVDNRSRSD